MTTTDDKAALTDIGPATPPPSWCLPDAVPNWEERLDIGGPAGGWCREISVGVWIEAHDRIIDNRMMRSAPRINYSESPCDGITSQQARELAEALIAAADLLEGQPQS
jgi:hypothetical protein